MAVPGFQQMLADPRDQSSFRAPNLGYYSPGQNVPSNIGEIFTPPQQIGMQVLQQMTGGLTSVVTQQVVNVPEPQTQCALIMSVLSSIFCCFMCGIMGIFVSWRVMTYIHFMNMDSARLYLLENKLKHARHSVNIVWILLALTVFFGIITWIIIGVMVLQIPWMLL